VLAGQAYFILTGLLLIAAAVLMVIRRAADAAEERRFTLSRQPASGPEPVSSPG
jgi:hypothetical protein